MSTTVRNTLLIVLLAGVIVAVGVFSGLAERVFGNVTDTDPAGAVEGTFQTYTFFATSTNQTMYATSTQQATSTNITAWFDSNGRKDNGYFVIAGADRVQFYFTYQGATTTGTGTGRFKVQVSPDGTNWYYSNKLVLATSTTRTLVTEMVTGQATSTVTASLDLEDDTWYAVRCIADHAVLTKQNGEFLCKATAQF